MKMQRKVYEQPCPDCCGWGTGKAIESQEKCSKCNGKGWRISSKAKVLCDKCNGDGLILSTKNTKCQNCKGQGYIAHVVEVLSSITTYCTRCNGRGYLYECHYCDSISGYYNDSANQPRCKSCKAFYTQSSRTRQCNMCFGEREITTEQLRDIKTGEHFTVKTPDCDDFSARVWGEDPR